MTPDLKEVISRVAAEALIYLYTDVGPMTDYRLLNECAELELDASEVGILKTRQDLIQVGVLERKGITAHGHSMYGLTKTWETPSGRKAN